MEMISKSKLGFGMMRLPKAEDGSIDIARTSKMVDDFLAAGYTYFDTAYVYQGSEVAVRQALVERHPRESFTIASKLPAGQMKEPADADRLFNETCERLGVDYLDFYLLHNVDVNQEKTFNELGCWEWGKQKKAEGKIRHFGFSTHGTPEQLDRLLTDHPEVEFVQLQLNYFDWEDEKNQARAMYEVAVKHGVPIVVMEPVRGGSLAALPEEPTALFKAARPDASVASWGMRYIASKEGVMTVLSGMSAEDQMEDNLKTFNNFEPMTAEDEATVQKAIEILHSYPTIPCTACKYCVEGCPMQINIPAIISNVNKVRMFGETPANLGGYGFATRNGGKASECIGCGACTGECPQHIDIPAVMQEAAGIFEK